MSVATVITRGYGSFGTIGEVVTLGYSTGELVIPITPANVGTIGNMPDFGTSYSKPAWMQPARYNPHQWKPMRFKRPW